MVYFVWLDQKDNIGFRRVLRGGKSPPLLTIGTPYKTISKNRVNVYVCVYMWKFLIPAHVTECGH